MAADAGFTDAQLQHISNMIRTGLSTDGKQQIDMMIQAGNTQVQTKTAELLKKVDEYHAQKGQEIEAKMGAIATQQEQMKEYMQDAESRRATIEEKLVNKETQIEELVEKLSEHEKVKESIIAELNGRQREMEEFKRGIEALNVETRRTVKEATGGWKDNAEQNIEVVKSQFGYRVGGMQYFGIGSSEDDSV